MHRDSTFCVKNIIIINAIYFYFSQKRIIIFEKLIQDITYIIKLLMTSKIWFDDFQAL